MAATFFPTICTNANASCWRHFSKPLRLERRVVESEQQAAELNRVLSETSTSYERLQQEHAATLDELAWYKRWAYGRRRERFEEGEGQGHLFALDANVPASDDAAEPPSSDDGIDVQGYCRRRKKREIDWDKLPQIRHEHDLPEEEKICSCCGRPMDRIGEDVTRELELKPAKLEAHIHVRPKYACRCCKEGVCAAPLPQRPIPGGIAGPGLVAEVIVSKFGDHLPLYRLEDILVRSGVYISRSTLCDWVRFAAELFLPLYELQRQRVLQSTVMWTDDTPVTVIGGLQGSFQGHFWAYLGYEHPYSVYDFTKSHARDGPARFLQKFTGYLHADTFTGYDAIFLGPHAAVQEVACWACAMEILRCGEKLSAGITPGAGMDSSTVRYRRPLSHVVARGSPAASCCRVNPRVGQDGGPLGATGRDGSSQEQFGEGGQLCAKPRGGPASLHGRWSFDDRQ